jgi:uncharacterized membrane-anchored protein
MKKHLMVVSSIMMGLTIALSFNISRAGEVKNLPSTQAGEKSEMKTETKQHPAMGVIMFGKVEVVGRDFVLKTEGSKEFKLEGKDFKNYVGKEVEVKGLLIHGTNTIRVSEIKPAK